MAKEFKITGLRLADLEKELNYLKTTREREVAAMIAEAITHISFHKRRINKNAYRLNSASLRICHCEPVRVRQSPAKMLR